MRRPRLPAMIAATLLALAAGAPPAQAQVPSARLACESAAGRLRLEVTPEVAAASAPRGADIATFERMVRTVPYPAPGHEAGYDGAQSPAHDFVRRCTLAGARYVLTLRAHPFGTHFLGRCGAALPSFDLTLARDGRALLDALLLQDNCGDTGSFVGITRVVADERARTLSLSVAASDLDREAGWPAQAELAIPFDELRAAPRGHPQREAILARVPRTCRTCP